jgi:hypothetical protein
VVGQAGLEGGGRGVDRDYAKRRRKRGGLRLGRKLEMAEVKK